MTFDDLPSGSSVFLDSNTLLYATLGHPAYGATCSALLDRIEHQDLLGFTSSDVLGETAHRAMTLEAVQRFAWPAQGIANRLRRHPSEVQQLLAPRRTLDEIQASRVTGLPTLPQQVSLAVDLSQQLGLLSGDALIVAVMRDHGLAQLASLDSDFDRVPGLVRFAPV